MFFILKSLSLIILWIDRLYSVPEALLPRICSGWHPGRTIHRPSVYFLASLWNFTLYVYTVLCLWIYSIENCFCCTECYCMSQEMCVLVLYFHNKPPTLSFWGLCTQTAPRFHPQRLWTPFGNFRPLEPLLAHPHKIPRTSIGVFLTKPAQSTSLQQNRRTLFSIVEHDSTKSNRRPLTCDSAAAVL